MRFTLTIDCDNAAFEGKADAEVARILRQAARDVVDGFDTRGLVDAAGNSVGRFGFEK